VNSRRVCIAASILVLALAIAGIITTPKCGDDRGLGPVIALELSTNGTQVGALLTSPECISGLRENTLFDIFAFIPSFAVFLIAASFRLGRKIAAPLFALGAICDWLEDSVMLHILGMPMPTFEWLSALMFASRLKFFALSVGIIVLGWTAKISARVRGLLMIIGGAIAIFGLLIDHRLLMPGTLIAWFSLAAFALKDPR
jgi:hypothetical protein